MVGSDQRGPLHSHGVARRLSKPFEPPAPVAQRIEHLTTDQKVGGSNPSGCASVSPSQAPKEPRRGIGGALALSPSKQYITMTLPVLVTGGGLYGVSLDPIGDVQVEDLSHVL